MTTQIKTKDEINVQTGKALLDAFNAKDLSIWERALAADFTFSYPGLRNGGNREVAKAFNAVFPPAIPDLKMEIVRTVLDDSGDTVIYQWVGTGHHNGPLQLPTGVVPATGRAATVPGILIVTLKDGKIVREETYWNQIDLLAQLGLM